MAVRASLALVCAAAIGILGVWLRDARLVDDARDDSARRGISTAELEGIADRFERARLLDPDSRPELALGALFLLHGRPERAIPWFQHVVRREPDNVEAWSGIAAAARDPALVARAGAQVRRLNPLSAGSR